jgi:hypothetical protein
MSAVWQNAACCSRQYSDCVCNTLPLCYCSSAADAKCIGSAAHALQQCITLTTHYCCHCRSNVMLQVRRIDAAKDIAETLSHSRGNVTYLPAGQGSNMLLGLNTGGQ